MGPLVAHALGLSGIKDGASVLLHLIGHTDHLPLQQAAAESFFTITGIESRPNAFMQEGTPAAFLQQELRAAWSPTPKDAQTSPRRHMMFGRPADAAGLLQGLAHMQVGRWQSIRRMLLSRSLGALRLSPWALIQQQMSELHSAQSMVTQTLNSAAPGLLSNSLTHALMRLEPSV